MSLVSAAAAQHATSDLRAALRAVLAVPEVRLGTWERSADSPEVLVLRGLGDDLTFDLRRQRLRAPDFAVTVQRSDGTLVDVADPDSLTWRGTLRGRPELGVAAALEPAGPYLWIAGDDELQVIEPVAALIAGAPADLVVAYRTGGMPADACGVTAAHAHGSVGGGVTAIGPDNPLRAEIAFDCDADFYAFRGSSVTAVVADIERTLNAVNVVYEREVSLTHSITRIVVRTAEPDPYDGNDSGVILGTQFRDEWNGPLAGVPRDTAHFVTSRDLGNILGLAYVSVVCDRAWSYGLSRYRSGFGGNVDVECHELGHNWSCPHCLDTCDVMCGCGAAGGFGPNDRAQIATFLQSRTCLEPVMPELVRHFRLDESGGLLATDAGPFASNGVYRGGVAFARAGAASTTQTAIGFDGVDDHVVFGGGAELATLDRGVSVAAWLRADVVTGSRRLVSNGTSWSFGLIGDRLVMSLHGVGDLLSSARVVAGRWTHVAVALDGGAQATFFVDGVRIDSRVGGSPRAIGGSWYLGSRDGATQFVDGDLDDVQIYDGALVDGQVAYLAAHPGSTRCVPGYASYGSGLAGTDRVPDLSGVGLPSLGRPFTLHVVESTRFVVYGALLLGPVEAALPAFGGTILVDPGSSLAISRLIAIGGINIEIPVPNDPALSCATFFAQFVQVDGGAVRGLAFTPGLRITLGG